MIILAIVGSVIVMSSVRIIWVGDKDYGRHNNPNSNRVRDYLMWYKKQRCEAKHRKEEKTEQA